MDSGVEAGRENEVVWEKERSLGDHCVPLYLYLPVSTGILFILLTTGALFILLATGILFILLVIDTKAILLLLPKAHLIPMITIIYKHNLAHEKSVILLTIVLTPLNV